MTNKISRILILFISFDIMQLGKMRLISNWTQKTHEITTRGFFVIKICKSGNDRQDMKKND